MYLFIEYAINRCQDDAEYRSEVVRVLERIETAAKNAREKLEKLGE
tara:strand:- start:519 stop:656 length:138 start_codon:yes stop_codon:yes gene_type:complete